MDVNTEEKIMVTGLLDVNTEEKGLLVRGQINYPVNHIIFMYESLVANLYIIQIFGF